MEPTVLDRLLAISALFQQHRQHSLADSSLSETREHALQVLHHNGPSTQQALSAILGTTPRSVSALVDGLVSTGYAVRIPHPEDRRAVLVSLTDLARRRMEEMQAEHKKLSEQLVNAVDDADRDAFERGINAVFWQLNDLARNPH